MTPEPPEPEARRKKGPARPDGAQPLPPRVLVSVGDLEDPAEWDVILVENQDIDDDTARRIAAERAGRPLPPPAPGKRLGAPRRAKNVSLPSLDERDVLQAFETDREAEDAEEISVDAFALPGDGATVVRRPTSTELPPEHDHFAGVPEPGDEVAPEDEAPPTDDEVAFPLAVADEDDEAAHDEPAEEEPEAAAEPAEPWEPAHREGPALIDDPDDEFYALQDEVEDDEAPTEVEASDDGSDADGAERSDDEGADDGSDAEDDDADEPTAEAEGEAEDDVEPEAPAFDPSAADREVLDDPDADFYEVGRRTPAPPAPIAAGPALPPPTPVGDLWGSPSTAPGAGDVFEDEVETDSSYPLGPDDLAVDGQVEPVALDSLDYANVFGPVTGSLAVPDLTAVPPRAAKRGSRRSSPSGRGAAAIAPGMPGFEDELYVFEEDAEEQWPVAAPRPGRRRELVALGLAAGVIVALGVGSQVFSRSDPQDTAIASTTSSSTRVRARTTDTTAPDLTLPTLPSDQGDPQTGVTTETTARRGSGANTTTTTRKAGVTTTTQAAVTTTTQAPVTTTTDPPTTTTEAPPETTPTTG